MPKIPQRPPSLKAASKLLVQANGGIAATGRLLGLSQSRVQQLTAENSPTYLQVNQVLALELASGNSIVTGFLAHEQGASIFKLPTSASDHRLNIAMARIGETISQLFAGYQSAFDKNGAFNQRAISRLIRESDDAWSRITEFRAHLQARR